MKKTFEAKVTTIIDAPVARVWKALTDPSEIKEYFFGTETISDWKKGSSIKFRGEWEGTSYEDKGTILEVIPEKKLVYNYWSSMSNTEDIPENYANITYNLSLSGNGTLLEIIQDGIADEAKKAHSEANWQMILDNLKTVVYNKSMAL
ncbi:MAG TPA: SRPBCC family protein [Bacteroidales bacterium]|nr:SRPBCC family protein [Bacteroidales bacterium]